MCGICNNSFHYNKKNNRVGGNQDIRGSHTYRSTSEGCKCGVRLTVKIHNEGKVDGFCYLLSVHGSRYHTFHPIPPVDMISKSCKNLSDADIKLLNSTNNITLPNTSMRRVLMEHSNEYVTKSSARYIVDNMPDSLRAKKLKGTSSTGQDMVNWLRKEASIPNVRLRYKILSHLPNNAPSMHKKPKGRPKKKSKTISEDGISRNMSYQSSKVSVSNVEEDHIDNVDIGCLECSHNCHGSSYDFCNDNMLERSETIAFDDTSLESNCFQKREILNKYRYGDYKILLGAAWMYPDAWREYMRFPEVLFIDATHSTNNESRPLLLLCGRGANEKNDYEYHTIHHNHHTVSHHLH